MARSPSRSESKAIREPSGDGCTWSLCAPPSAIVITPNEPSNNGVPFETNEGGDVGSPSLGAIARTTAGGAFVTEAWDDDATDDDSLDDSNDGDVEDGCVGDASACRGVAAPRRG